MLEKDIKCVIDVFMVSNLKTTVDFNMNTFTY